jgi:hypothetical protein
MRHLPDISGSPLPGAKQLDRPLRWIQSILQARRGGSKLEQRLRLHAPGLLKESRTEPLLLMEAMDVRKAHF